MKQLPFDVVRCAAKNECPDKQGCARFTSPGRPEGFQAKVDASVIRTPEHCGMFENNADEEVPNV